MDYEERLERAKTNQDANCWGTAYFLSGASDELVDKPDLDWSMEQEGSMAYWSRLKILDRPSPLCYAGIVGPMPKQLEFLDGEYLYHLAIITNLKPIRITHRNGNRGPLIENELLATALSRDLINPNLRVEFRSFKN